MSSPITASPCGSILPHPRFSPRQTGNTSAGPSCGCQAPSGAGFALAEVSCRAQERFQLPEPRVAGAVGRLRAVQSGGAERHSRLSAQHRCISRSLLSLTHSLAPCSCGEIADSGFPCLGRPSEHSSRSPAASAPSGRAENISEETLAHSQHKIPPEENPHTSSFL